MATNIAETSITIDDVVYVIDCGKAKESSYDVLNKLACLRPSWIAKSSANQVSSASLAHQPISLLRFTHLNVIGLFIGLVPYDFPSIFLHTVSIFSFHFWCILEVVIKFE